jgi:hypothetical protein
MLNPGRGLQIAAHLRLVGQLKKRHHIAAAAIEKDVHIGIIFPGGGHMILRKGVGIGHAQYAGIPIDRLSRVTTAISDVVDAVQIEGRAHSTTSSTPREI